MSLTIVVSAVVKFITIHEGSIVFFVPKGGNKVPIKNHLYEEQTRRLLAETQSDLTIIENQIAELQQKREVLKREAEAHELALRGYLRRTGRLEFAEPDWAKMFEGQTHKEKLITIAKHNSGRIKVNKATDILYTKGFIKSRKRANAYTIVQTLLANMAEEGKFEKIKSGEYRLIST